ncbi:MAG TPA: HPF/RaiA family ribosome-associated protein [Candidatus Obscuribacterales bacterium]
MKLPVQVVFRNMKRSEWLASVIREKVGKLDNICDSLMSCRVVVEIPHRHHRKGNFYHIRIDISAPEAEIVVNREPPEHAQAEDLNAALRDAFDSAKRKVEDYVRKRRGFVKTHSSPPHGKVIQLFPEEGYGFLETPDGREVYFHSNSVIAGNFERLEIGSEVAYSEEEGEKGAQASTVRLVS